MTRRYFTHIGLILCSFWLISNVAQECALYAVAAWRPAILQNSWGYFAVTLLPMYLLAMPHCALLLRLRTTGAPPKRSLSAAHVLTVVPIGVMLMIAGNLIGLAINFMIGLMRGEMATNSVSNLIGSSAFWPTVLFAAILAPILEELIFRKFLIDAIYPYGELTAVLVSGLTFGAFHGNLYQFFYATALGLVFAYMYCKTGKLRYSILFHMGVNLSSTLVSQLVLPHLNTDPESLTLGDIPALLAALGYEIIVFGLSIVGLVLLIVNFRKIRFDRPAPPHQSGPAAFANVGMILFFVLCGGMCLISLFQ